MADHHHYDHDLSNAALKWPTAQAYSHQDSNQPGQVRLDLAAKKWHTPDTAPEAPNELLLRGQAKAWATPNWHDGRRPGPDLHSTQGRNLSREAALSHQAPQTQQDGQPGSPSGRVLNPRFVEMLMGWPSGLTDYESPVMALCPWYALMRSSLYRLGWELSYDS